MSDGQFSTRPLRGEPARNAGEYSEKPVLSADAVQTFLQSRAVQREMNALAEQSRGDFGQFDCAPLDGRTPAAARELGEPLASAALMQEYLSGFFFLRAAGWIAIVIAVIIIVGAGAVVVSAALNRADPRNPAVPAPIADAVFRAIAAFLAGSVGAWFAIFRGRVVTERCWFCPGGMIWMTNGAFDWYRWDDVPEVFCDLQAERPAIGISFGRNVSWISFSESAGSRQMVDYLEKLASAACVKSMLQRLAEGKTIRFGPWRLSQSSIRSADKEILWENVVDVECSHLDIDIIDRDNRKLAVPFDEVPFPSLFLALARACCAFARERR